MIFLILLILAVCLTLIFGIAPWRRVGVAPETAQGAGILPKISIIAYALRNEHDTAGYLDRLLQQDYPDFEVILVCDASAEATAVLSEKFENISNLHLTFIPPGSHSLSRRKLAQTIGIKAASGDIVLLTATSALPESDQWLKYMAAPFADRETVAALGFIRRNARELTGSFKSYKIFDYLLTSAQWISAALAGHPFRSNGFNLAFRRNLFFELKGYASSITLMDGDDDIFIGQLSRYGVCTPVLAPEAYLISNWGYRADNLHNDLKDRWNFTRRFLPKAPFIRAGMTSAAQWLIPLLALCAILPALPQVFPTLLSSEFLKEWGMNPLFGFKGESSAIASLIIAVINIMVFWIMEVITLKQCALKLRSEYRYYLTIPFLMWRPVGNLIFKLWHQSSSQSHYSKHN